MYKLLNPIELIDTSIKKDIIINHIMKSKGVYLLVSNPKVGKSMLALQLSCSVINGTSFLGYQVNPSPVLYITTESDSGQLKERLSFMELEPRKGSLFPIDRQNKVSISLRDLELEIKIFSEENKGKLIIIDMLKDIDFGIEYDINNYQDIAQKVLPKLRYYCDKYNVTFLVTHHLNKNGKTLGSVALDATVDGRITLIENKSNKKYIKLQMINRDFSELDIQLKKQDNLIFKKINSIEEEELSYELTSFIKYIASQKEIDFTCTDIVLKANIQMSPKRFGRLLNNSIELLESEGVHITKCRTSDSRSYHALFIEPSQSEDE